MTDPLHLVCPHCDTTNRVPRERLADAPVCGHCGKALFDGHPLALTAANFERQVTRNDIPVVVDFWADWCGPCKMMAPVLQDLAREWKGRITVIKIDTDKKPELASRFGISGIPTLILFKGGREAHRITGAMPLPDLKRELNPRL
ncbi:MAG TPA: thioredoxin TrxC [Casimicrobiaceae bacterium]|nr:thioredoxin TrxC [Casimicrobiaceae bacterium]